MREREEREREREREQAVRQLPKMDEAQVVSLRAALINSDRDF